MADWGFLSSLFGTLQAHSPMLGRFWLLLMLVFRMLVLGTVASDLFDDEQEEFACNTLQPGCKQVCYDAAFPISQYRFWVFHIVLISTPSLVFLMYAMHHHGKQEQAQARARALGRGSGTEAVSLARQERRLRRLYLVNVGFRLLAEVGFVVGQWGLYGFRVEARFPCSRFPCPYTVDCFTSRPAEKTVFLCFYFAVGVLSVAASLAELVHVTCKGFWGGAGECEGCGEDSEAGSYFSQNFHNLAQEGAGGEQRQQRVEAPGGSSGRPKAGSGRSGRSSRGRKYPSAGRKSLRGSSSLKSSMLMV